MKQKRNEAGKENYQKEISELVGNAKKKGAMEEPDYRELLTALIRGIDNTEHLKAIYWFAKRLKG